MPLLEPDIQTVSPKKIAGERHEDLSSIDYLIARPEATPARQDIGTTETLARAVPAAIVAIVPNAGHTGNLAVRDAAAISGGSIPVLNLDLSPGEPVFLGGARFENGITLQGDDAACDVTLISYLL